MRPFTAIILGATTLLTAATAPAATITITDCGVSPVEKVGKRTVISRPADDVTIQCALLPLAGTTRIEITARSVTADGAQGGSIVAAGKGLAIEIVATGTDADDRSVALTRSTLTAANPNGDVEISGPGAILVGDSALQAGGFLRISCSGPSCPITLDGSRLAANDIELAAQGDVTGRSSRLETASPIDTITVTSATGDVKITNAVGANAAVGSFICRDDIIRLCPGPDCPLPVTIDSVDAAVAFCECNQEDVPEIETGIEGDLRVEAPQGDVDLRGAKVKVGEDVTVTAGGTADVGDASVQNCGPKTGRITVTAATCKIANATLLDDEPDPQPSLQCTVQGQATQLGSCDAQR